MKCERRVFRAKRKRERVSAEPIESHQEVAEERSRGAEPSGGFAARRRKRAGHGYMLPFARVEHGLPLRQRMLPSMPQQRHTLRTTPSTRFYNRALEVLLLKISAGQTLCSGPQVSRLKPDLAPPGSGSMFILKIP